MRVRNKKNYVVQGRKIFYVSLSVDNRAASINLIHLFETKKKKKKKKNLHNTLHLTRDMWNDICDMLHVTHGGCSLKIADPNLLGFGSVGNLKIWRKRIS